MLGKISKIERLGISFLLGNGLSTFVWFILYRLGAQFDLLTLGFSGLTVFLVSYFINKLFKFKYQNLVIKKFTGLNLKIIYLVVILLLISFVIGNYNPISGWDAVALYDFRGHTIALNHSLKDLTDGSYYLSYPLMISLDHAAIYMLKGISAQGLHSIILMAFIAVVYGRMLKWTNSRLSLLTILFIILNEEIFSHSTVAYTNLAYVVYLVAGFLYVISPKEKSRELGYLFVGGIMIGLTTWIRSDVPFWMMGIVLILIQGWKLRAKILAVFSIFLIYQIRHTWLSFFTGVLISLSLRNEGLSNPITLNALKQISSSVPNIGIINKIIADLPEIIRYVYLYIFSPYRGLWLLTIPIAAVVIKKKDYRLLLLFLTILMSALMVTVGIMLFSATYPTWDQIGGSARRMMLFIVPLSIITSIYALHLIKTGRKYNA